MSYYKVVSRNLKTDELKSCVVSLVSNVPDCVSSVWDKLSVTYVPDVWIKAHDPNNRKLLAFNDLLAGSEAIPSSNVAGDIIS